VNGFDPDDDSFLLRMVWSPRCYQDNRPTSACFDSKDLLPNSDENGKERFVSTDCEAEIVKVAVDFRIARQTRGDLRVTERRHEARFIRLNCGEVRAIPDLQEDQKSPMIIERDPRPAQPEFDIPENPAHCALRNCSPNSRTKDKAANRQYVEYLRTELLKRLRADLSYDEVFSSNEN
jgi:hypothetical protein